MALTANLVNQFLKGNNTALIVWEKVDLFIDGGTPTTVALSKTFHVISRIIWHLSWSSAALTYTGFADGNALTNGVNVLVGGNTIFNASDTIKTNDDFFKYGYDVTVASDAGGTPHRILSARWTFTKSMPNGLFHYDPEYKLTFKVSDDMTAYVNVDEFYAVVQGYSVHA